MRVEPNASEVVARHELEKKPCSTLMRVEPNASAATRATVLKPVVYWLLKLFGDAF